MTFLALVLIGLHPRAAKDVPVNWVTLPESTMQVELHLYKDGRFEAHEWWTGPQSKPMPNYSLRGLWTQDWDSVTLEILTTYSRVGGVVAQKTKKLHKLSVHLVWRDALGRDHSLTKTTRKPAKIDFGPRGMPRPTRASSARANIPRQGKSFPRRERN